MKILIADDDSVSRRLLQSALTNRKYDVVVARDGREAWDALQREDAPKLAIVDWVMPELDGLEVCRHVRALTRPEPTYIILLTSNTTKEDTVQGLEAGADDYVTKPFDRAELRARLQVGRRIVDLQSRLAEQVRQLQETLNQVRQLQGLLPICCYCKKIRDDKNYWQQVEGYIGSRSNATFSHGICPDCYEKEILPQMRSAGIEPPRLEDF